MSSPSHRTVLSPKHSNSRLSSPVKNDKNCVAQQIESPFSNQRIRLSYNTSNSPTRNSQIKQKYSPKKPLSAGELGFKIFEDEVYYRDTLEDDDKMDIETAGQENYKIQPAPVCNKLNHFDQENVLQPKLKQRTLKQASHTKRTPLSNLNINEYAGYVTYNQFPIQLNEMYQPPNYHNEQKTTHKFNTKLPCFITPPRTNGHQDLITSKYLVKSSIEEEPFNEEDEIECRLIEKQNLMKKKRSLSVGKNDAKFKLIKKNNFQILSN